MKRKTTLCQYCTFFPGEATFSSSDKKKRKRCSKKRRKVFLDSPNCNRFSPSDYFWCDKNFMRIHFAACLNNRFSNKLENKNCKGEKCVQFEKEIRPIVVEYFLDSKKREPPEKFKIQMADDPKITNKKRITRRKKYKITRRKKT